MPRLSCKKKLTIDQEVVMMSWETGRGTLFDRPLDIRLTLEEVLEDLDEGWASWAAEPRGERP